MRMSVISGLCLSKSKGGKSLGALYGPSERTLKVRD
jgi:hypothetical protein